MWRGRGIWRARWGRLWGDGGVPGLILLCADGSYYTGCTTFLEQRYGQHQAGTFDGYTSKRRPVVMVWSQEVQSIDQAIFLERKIKGWSRAKKEALIRGEFDLLPLLSRSAYRRSGR